MIIATAYGQEGSGANQEDEEDRVKIKNWMYTEKLAYQEDWYIYAFN